VAATVHYLRSHFKTKIFFAMIVHNTEQHRSFVSMLPPQNRILPPGGDLSPLRKSLFYVHSTLATTDTSPLRP